MAEPSLPYGHPEVVKPRQRGYKHRNIIIYTNSKGCVTEHGEVISDPFAFARKAKEPYLWVCYDVSDLVIGLLDRYGESEDFRMGATGVAPPPMAAAVRSTDNRDKLLAEARDVMADYRKYVSDSRYVSKGKKTEAYIQKITPSTFGWHEKGKRRQGRHMIVNPALYTAGGIAASQLVIPNTPAELTRWATGMREWCKENDLPIGRSLSSIGASLSRDARFWPNDRGRVPSATNEKVREYLPGVTVKCEDRYSFHGHVLTLDQRRAYHTIAKETPLPDPTTLYARGYFYNPTKTDRLWTYPGRKVYERTLKQPGLYALLVRVRNRDEMALPCVQERGERIVFVWSPEVRELDRDPRVTIIGMRAAWTSTKVEEGLATYGAWALEQIAENPDLAAWLKPSLHSMYGLLAAKPTVLLRAELHMANGVDYPIYYNGRKVPFKAMLIPHTSAVTNVCVLGVLQAELRVRTLEMARHLVAAGAKILRIHSDGLHFTVAQLPTYDEARWKLEEIHSVHYFDDVTYICDERIVAPGRHGSDDDRLKRILSSRLPKRPEVEVAKDREAVREARYAGLETAVKRDGLALDEVRRRLLRIKECRSGAGGKTVRPA